MGNLFGKSKTTHRIIFQGLDAAGKTSILYKLKLGEVVTTIPTIGFNVETVSMNNIDIFCWDIGGRDKSRPLMRHYYQNTQGVVFVIDSTDKERLDDAFENFIDYTLNEDELRNIVVMVLANKQDLDGALSCEEVEKKWRERVPHSNNQEFLFRSCSVTTGKGLFEAFNDFTQRVGQKEEKKSQDDLEAAVKRHEISVKLLCQSPAAFAKSILFY